MNNFISATKSTISMSPDITETETVISFFKPLLTTPGNVNSITSANTPTSAILGNGSTVISDDNESADNYQSYKITGKNIKVLCSSGMHHDGSSKVKLKNIVNYQWEVKTYPGHLIAVHIDGKHVAYVIKVTNKINGTEEGMVRVVNTGNGQRALIKGISAEVLDVQFALIERIHILACIDLNALYIHQIDMLSDNLICNLLLKIEDPLENYSPKYNKITWCPNFPDSNGNGNGKSNASTNNDDEEEEDDDVSQLIVWCRGKIFQCFNVTQIISAHGIGTHFTKNLSDGYVQSSDITMAITWVALSPDGTTLGVGSDDGFIRFYQIYFHEKEPRCLHHWKPHNGKPISSFFFLDDLKNWKATSDEFWKYAVTACNNNTEFKIWDCGSWECQQQIKFNLPGLDSTQAHLNFNAEMDVTASYLVLSNIELKTLYILNISSSSKLKRFIDAKGEIKRCKMLVRSISEFPISSPTLSFSIVDVSTRKLFKCAMNENYVLDDIDDFDEENNSISCVVLKMFLVQPKSVQECHILYKTMIDENDIIEHENENEDEENIVTNDRIPVSNSVLVEDAGELYSSIVKHPKLLNKIKSLQSNGEDNDEEEISNNCSNSSVKSGEEFRDTKTISVKTMTILEENLKKSPLIPSLASIELPSKPIDIEAPPASILNQFSSPQINLMTPDSFSNISVSSSLTQSGKKVSPAETVNSNVFNTILMLANVTNNSTGVKPTELFVNNKMIEDQQKLRAVDKNKQASHTKFVAIDQKAMEPMTGDSSPPSREVQEIMGLSESNLSQFSYETDKTFDIKSLSNILDSSNKENAKKKTQLTEWPKVPDIKPVQNIKVSNEIPSIISNTNTVSTSTQVKLLTTSTCTENVITTPSNDIHCLTQTLSQLINVIQVQSQQIQSLEKEINHLKFRDNSLSIATITSDIIESKLEIQVQRLFENCFERVEKTQADKIQQYLATNEIKNSELRDRMQSHNQVVFTQLLDKVAHAFKHELQRSVIPALIARLEVIQRQIQTQISDKLSATDQTIKESILQLCKSKNMIDTFGKSVLQGVQGSLQAAFIESMTSTLIPAYEKSSQQMFRQLHETFSIPIKEVMEQLDNYLTQLQPVQDTTDEILSHIVKFREQVELLNKRQCQEINDNYMETKKEIKTLEINFLRHFTEVIKKEIRKNFESQVASLEDSVLLAVRSQAATPAPSTVTVYDVQDQIKQLLGQGQINLAFHQALLANDLALVEYTLEKADHKNVFNPCRLEQTVLLSLIQQISADMTHHNELKQKYLSDGILNLNLNDPVTKEHAPKVMKELYRNCQNYIQANVKNPLCSNIRMIVMAIQGMGYRYT